MLLQSNVNILTIYDHEEDFDNLVQYLEKRTQKREIRSDDENKEFLGYDFVLEDRELKMFCDRFDIVFGKE